MLSVKHTRRMRTLWLTALLSLLTLSGAGLVFIFNMVAGPGWSYIDALPTWAEATVITSGILSMWVAGLSLFFWSNEFGIRSLHRWRYTGQQVIADSRRGSYVGTCPGTWDGQDPAHDTGTAP